MTMNAETPLERWARVKREIQATILRQNYRKPPPSMVDEKALFESHDIGLAEQNARREAKLKP